MCTVHPRLFGEQRFMYISGQRNTCDTNVFTLWTPAAHLADLYLVHGPLS